MYINTFKYTPEDVDCKLCTEYVKKFGCTACGCPWMAERIEAGVVSYAEVVRQMFPHDKLLMARLEISPHDYTLYIAARGIYTNAGGLTTRDLADAEVVDAAALRMIVNALLIARYGCAVLDIHERGRKA